MTGKLRFGVVSESVQSGPAWLDHVRRIEDAGIGALRPCPSSAGCSEAFGWSYLVTPDRDVPALTKVIADL